MNSRVVVLIAILSVLAGLGVLAYQKLEIYRKTVKISPSGKAAADEYYALERWLSETGHPVRIEKQSSAALIAAGPEKTALVQASLCDWKNAKTILEPWMKQGGFLVIILDSVDDDAALQELLESYGIWPESFISRTDKETPDWREEEAFAGEEVPDFYSMRFYIAEGSDVFTISPNQNAKLVQAALGEGMLTVIYSNYFMNNTLIKKEVNARLAWNLTGAQAMEQNPGVLFVQGRYRGTDKGLLEKLAKWGNLLPPVLSVILLVVLGFWMVIPVFGKVLREKQSAAKPMRERFLAEARFLDKYKTLDYYVQIYERELKLERQETAGGRREIIKRLRDMQAITEGKQWKI